MGEIKKKGSYHQILPFKQLKGKLVLVKKTVLNELYHLFKWKDWSTIQAKLNKIIMVLLVREFMNLHIKFYSQYNYRKFSTKSILKILTFPPMPSLTLPFNLTFMSDERIFDGANRAPYCSRGHPIKCQRRQNSFG